MTPPKWLSEFCVLNASLFWWTKVRRRVENEEKRRLNHHITHHFQQQKNFLLCCCCCCSNPTSSSCSSSHSCSSRIKWKFIVWKKAEKLSYNSKIRESWRFSFARCSLLLLFQLARVVRPELCALLLFLYALHFIWRDLCHPGERWWGEKFFW